MMIHQLIFAKPRPGMTEKDFQEYWLNVHAVQYTSKIAQIRRYMICTRLNCGPSQASSRQAGEPFFSGVAEIWLRSEDQIASLQSKEFLEGARADEPRWAAFWATLALDTEAYPIIEGPELIANPSWVKFYRMLKRSEGVPLGLFREFALGPYADSVRRLPGIRRCLQCHVRDALYEIGEARFDAVEQWWFDDVAALQAALESSAYLKNVSDRQARFVQRKYLFTMAAREHWIIGPKER
jgi:hypothetical protein